LTNLSSSFCHEAFLLTGVFGLGRRFVLILLADIPLERDMINALGKWGI
jgi:hypothetical protein